METAHVGLNVTDISRSRTFYQRVFGLAVMAEGDQPGHFAFLGRDGSVMITLWQQSEGTFPVQAPGLHHLSFQVGSMDEVRAAEKVLRELGTEITYDGAVAHGEGAPSGGIFFTDPDGIRLEIYSPTGAESLTAPTAGPSCGFF